MAAASTAWQLCWGLGLQERREISRKHMRGWSCRVGPYLTQVTRDLRRKFFSLPPDPRIPVLSLFPLEEIGRALAASSSVQTAPSPKGPDN